MTPQATIFAARRFTQLDSLDSSVGFAGYSFPLILAFSHPGEGTLARNDPNGC
jgi:hypothetical protein